MSEGRYNIDSDSSCPSPNPLPTGERAITVLGAMSNVIVRDGGVRGAVIRMGKEFAGVEIDGDLVRAGAAALDGTVAQAAAEAGIGGLEFLSTIPGSIGGALRMNAGCYGTETKDVLVEAEVLDRQGNLHVLKPDEMSMTYRHSGVPEDWIFVGALFQGTPDDPVSIHERIAELKERRAQTQPIREKTGGSTFANPEGHKAWELIDKVGGRGLKIGGAMMSEKHCNFMINTGDATAADLENLGEELRRRVREETGIDLCWEIRRIGEV